MLIIIGNVLLMGFTYYGTEIESVLSISGWERPNGSNNNF